jgi:membrane associated rhomboid family serine protease
VIPLKDNIPLSRLPLVTLALILANVVVYLLEIRHGGSFLGGPSTSVEVRYGAIPYELTHPGRYCGLATASGPHGPFAVVACQGQPGVSGTPSHPLPAWATVLSAMFLHASFLHIFGNMLFLGIFGPAVEDAMGRLRYAGFYLLGGIAALGAQVASNPAATGPTLGASGAIAAVLGGYVLLYPRAKVLSIIFIIFFVTIVEVPALLLLGFWFALQLYLGLAGLASSAGGAEGVAYFAHIGGFAFGLLTIRLLARRRAPPRVLAF